MSEQDSKLFNTEVALVPQNDAAAIARATQEVQAALVIGMRNPRDEIKIKAKIIEACKRKELAEVAEYEYERGGTKITGPTIDLLRAIANRWGNIRFGWSEVDRRDGYSMVRCFAWDTQTNGQAERTFSVKHWRDTRSGGYALKDERDIYELMANQAARRVRACLEEVIDADVVQAAIDQCRITMKTGHTESLKDRAVKILLAFAQFGVTQAMVEEKLGNKMDALSENQYASLRRVWKALNDGVGKREDYFKTEAAKPEMKEPAPPADKPSGDKPKTKTAPKEGPLSMLRALCAGSQPPVKEIDLLNHLASTGATGGEFASLDDLPANIVQAVIDQWADIVARMSGDNVPM